MKTQTIFVATSFALSLAVVPIHAEVDFTKQVAPVLEQHCIKCHGPNKKKGHLRLDLKAEAFKSDEVIIVGNADKSELFHRVSLPAGDDDIMPAEGDPLSKEDQELLKNWINEGAKWPDDFVIKGKKAATEEAAAPKKQIAWPPDHEITATEKAAIEKLNGLGIAVRPIAMNSNWQTANLRVYSGDLSDELLTALGQVTALVDLNLASTKIDDEKLAKLANLTNLMTLHLENTKVTDAGLKNLEGMKFLNYLNLYGTTVSDAGLDSLKGLTHLEKLYAWQTQVTDAGVAKLKEANPELYVNTGASLVVAEEKKEEKTDEAKK